MLSEKIKISVLLSVFDTDFILTKRAIDSVLNQSYQNFELIVIDDGSRADQAKQIKDYAKEHENKIIYLQHENCGQSESINRGVLNSCGEYISIIDSDDEYKFNHLSKCLNEMKDADLIASVSETIVGKDEDYFVPDKNNLNKLIHVDDCILFATLFGKKEVFENIHFKGKYAADANFYELAAKKYKVKKVDLKTYIYYRNNANSIVGRMKNSIQ